MGLNVSATVTGSGLVAADAPCCRPNYSGISGQKFFDVNLNGVRDSGEPPLSGWTINLSNGASTVTDTNGYYYFTLASHSEDKSGVNPRISEENQVGPEIGC